MWPVLLRHLVYMTVVESASVGIAVVGTVVVGTVGADKAVVGAESAESVVSGCFPPWRCL
jgi:hypothetical protein